jgi:hypothetical protein
MTSAPSIVIPDFTFRTLFNFGIFLTTLVHLTFYAKNKTILTLPQSLLCHNTHSATILSLTFSATILTLQQSSTLPQSSLCQNNCSLRCMSYVKVLLPSENNRNQKHFPVKITGPTAVLKKLLLTPLL